MGAVDGAALTAVVAADVELTPLSRPRRAVPPEPPPPPPLLLPPAPRILVAVMTGSNVLDEDVSFVNIGDFCCLRLLRRRRRFLVLLLVVGLMVCTAAVDVVGTLHSGSVSTLVRGKVSVVSNIFSSVGELGQFCGNTSSMVMKASSPSECCPIIFNSSAACATKYSSGGRRSNVRDSARQTTKTTLPTGKALSTYEPTQYG